MLRTQHLLSDGQSSLVERQALRILSAFGEIVCRFVEEMGCFSKCQAIVFNECPTHQSMRQIAFTLLPYCDLAHIRKSPIDGSDGSLGPLLLHFVCHLCSQNDL